MNIIHIVIGDWRTLRNGKPGHRFRNYVDKRRERCGGRLTVARVLSFATGLALIVIGLSIGWLPGPGGFLAIIGLALTAQEFPIIGDRLDRIELFCRKIIRSVIHFFRRRSASGPS